MKFVRVFRWTDAWPQEPKVTTSPVLEPTEDNPSGVYGQFKGGTCIPGDWLGEDEDGEITNLSEVPHDLTKAQVRLTRLKALDKAALAYRDAHSALAAYKMETPPKGLKDLVKSQEQVEPLKDARDRAMLALHRAAVTLPDPPDFEGER